MGQEIKPPFLQRIQRFLSVLVLLWLALWCLGVIEIIEYQTIDYSLVEKINQGKKLSPYELDGAVIAGYVIKHYTVILR